MLRLTCPYCNHDFDLPPNATGARVPCPRCLEGVNVAKAVDVENAERTSLPSQDWNKPNRKWLLAVVLLSLVLGITALVIYTQRKTEDGPPSTKPLPPATTKPPMLLAGLRRMPSDVQLLVAIQPAVMADYAQRKNQSFDQFSKDLGLPASVLDQIRKLGLEPSQIDHLALGVTLNGIPPSVSIVLVLRQDVELTLKAEPIADKPGHFKVDLFGLPMEMKKIDGSTYQFATEGKKLDAPAMPNADHLSAGVKESLGKLSPASFAWVATDSQDWGANLLVKAGAAFAKQPDLPKKLENVRAIALGLSLEPEIQLTLAVRSPDSKGAEEMAKSWKERFAASKPEVSNDGTWATGRIPFDPPQEILGTLKKALGP